MDIKLYLLNYDDKENLFNFEKNNRDYFEKFIPSRGEDYYDYEIFLQRHKDLIDEQNSGLSFFYLIKDKSDNILGRINLVRTENDKIFSLGYRIGKDYTGQGIASKALNILLKIIDKEKIKEIHGKTTDDNLASQKIMEKNGFRFIGKDKESFHFNSKEVRFVNYIKK